MSITDGQRQTGGLEPFRRRLDHLDEQIVGVLGERFATVARSPSTSASTRSR